MEMINIINHTKEHSIMKKEEDNMVQKEDLVILQKIIVLLKIPKE